LGSYSGFMSLREVFDELAGGGDADPAEALADRGYGELPDPLLSEAIVSYADTAPVEVAEHLAPFVMVHSAVPVDRVDEVPAGDGLALLATAPEPIVPDEMEAEQPEAVAPEAEDPFFGEEPEEFEFGHGAEELAAWDDDAASMDIPAIDVAEMADFEADAPAADEWLVRPEVTAPEPDQAEDEDGGDAAAG
jgi:hypothetical protein